MSLQQLAQHMAAHGRGPDTMLMHVTPREVSRLQEAAEAIGGSLTINPHTGLPEAGFWDNPLGSVMDTVSSVGRSLGVSDAFVQARDAVTQNPLTPALLGAGLNYFMPGLGSLAAAGLVGGTYALGSGSLSKGLQAGLGAYGGSKLMGGVMGMGAGAAGASTVAQETAKNLMAQGYSESAAWEAVSASGGAGSTFGAGASGWDKLGAGASAAYDNPKGFVDAMGGWGKTAGTAAMIAAPAMAATSAKDAPAGVTAAPQTPQYIRPYQFQRTVRAPEAGIGSRQQQWFDDRLTELPAYPATQAAAGGIVALAGGGMSSMGSLGGYSDGGRLLRGPGDGVSDSIPATIADRQPARLADGEFVVPARIVSELGNGSTDAGARKLYAMMDRIQKARGKTTGKQQVAKNSRAEKYLPA
jgi:hypothetical protein